MRFSPIPKQLDPSTRDEILNVAQRVFASVGFKEATIRQICKAAKANVCLISYYFGSKDGLYQAVFQRAGEQRFTEIKSILSLDMPINSSEEYQNRLKVFIRSRFAEMREKRDIFQLMHREMSEGMPRAEEMIRTYIGKSRAAFVEFLEYGQKKKYIQKDLDLNLTALSVINMLFGFTMQLNTKPEFFFNGHSEEEISDSILKTITKIFFNGVIQ